MHVVQILDTRGVLLALRGKEDGGVSWTEVLVTRY